METTNPLPSPPETPVILPSKQPAPTNSYGKKNWTKWVLIITVITIGIGVFAYTYIFAGEKSCGGFTGETEPNACPNGYACMYPNKGPDQQGICIKSFSTKQPAPTIIPSPTSFPDETANWKTYTNPDIGFSIEYPYTLDKQYYRSTVGSFISFNLPGLKTNDATEKRMTIFDSINSYTTFKEAVDNHVDQTKNNAKIVRSPYILDGITGELLIEIYPVGVVHQAMYIQLKKTLLIFQVAYKPENKEKTLEYFDQIISTFRFTR